MGFATAALVGLGALQVGSSVMSGVSQNKEAKYNASLMEQQAVNIENQKGLTNYQSNRQIGQVMATSRVRTAGAGLEMSGSPMAVMMDTYTQMEMDKRINLNNLETEKQQAYSQAEAYRRKGKTALYQGYTNAFTSALSTGVNYGLMSGSFDTNYANTSMGRVNVAPANYYLRAGRL